MTTAVRVGGQSEVAPLRAVVLKHPRDAFRSEAVILQQWRGLQYSAPPNFGAAIREYDRFVELMQSFDVDLHFLPPDDTVGLDSLYVRDATVVCDGGVLRCNMGKTARRSEPAACDAAFSAMGLPMIGTINGDGCLEGGDVVWLDRRTVAVGRGYRTNEAGIEQLRGLLADRVDEVVTVPLPHWRGPDDVFHLMSVLSPIDDDLMLVYSPLLPVPFREYLLARGVTLVDVPAEEFESMGCNVLAVAPRRCVMMAGNQTTRQRLEHAGVEVAVFSGDEICRKGGGGPTCLTRPLHRAM
ncbi:MAG TPA: arginine deiminase family protein [Gemmatimonadales bacterium]